MNRFLFALAVLLAAPAHAADPAPLAASGKWILDKEPARCLLARSFGNGDDATTLILRPMVLGSYVEVIVVRRATLPAQGKAVIGVPGSTFSEDNIFRTAAMSGGAGQRAVMTVKRGVLAAIETSGALRVATAPLPPVTFTLAGAKPALAALAKCEAEVVAGWGVDPAAAARAVTPATMLTLRMDAPSAYPAAALAAKQQGTSLLIVGVDDAGRVTECRTVATSGSEVLDRESCRIEMRQRYKPALDAAGKPVASVFAKRFDWIIPK